LSRRDPLGLSTGDDTLDPICAAIAAMKRNCADVASSSELSDFLAAALIATGVGTEVGRQAADAAAHRAIGAASTTDPSRTPGNAIQRSLQQSDSAASAARSQRLANGLGIAGNNVGVVGVGYDIATAGAAIAEGDTSGALSSGSSAVLGVLAFSDPVAAVASVGAGIGLIVIDHTVTKPAERADEASRRRGCQLSINAVARLLKANPEKQDATKCCP
jgi:hypothetical protein